MERNDFIRIHHMYDAASEAVSFMYGRTRDDLAVDRQLALSLVKEIEIIGEAAGRVSEKIKQDLPNIPWKEITAMRNRLIHAYFDINLDIVWSCVQSELPELISQLRKIPGIQQ